MCLCVTICSKCVCVCRYVCTCVCVHTSVPCGSLLLSGSIVSGADDVCYYHIV